MATRSFDVIVVGAGLAGCTAAVTAARRGKSVLMIERGRRPGAKNMIGGVLYTPVLDRLFPDFAATAPVERHVVSRTFSFLTDASHCAFEVRSASFGAPPDYNRSYTIRRTAFDPWLVAQAKSAGATVLTSTVVDGLLHENDDPARPVVGIRARRAGGEVLGKVVILAEGANALIAERERLRPKTAPREVMLGVKQILRLDRGKIEDRFGVEGNEGRAFEFFGEPTGGAFGSGFLYTNAETLSIGVAASLAHLTRLRISPPELLDRFKAHPSIAPYIRGAEPVEYCAHLLPISSTAGMPEMTRDGLLLAGDAARMANMSHYKELTNIVTASGEAAGEAASEAIDAGDTTKGGLAGYERRLHEGFALRDVKKYAALADLIDQSPELLKKYPRLLVDAAVEHFSISERPKEEVERAMLRAWNRSVKPTALRRDMMAILSSTGFSMMPLIRRMAMPHVRSPREWFSHLTRRLHR